MLVLHFYFCFFDDFFLAFKGFSFWYVFIFNVLTFDASAVPVGPASVGVAIGGV